MNEAMREDSTAPAAFKLELRNLAKSFDGQVAVSGSSLGVRKGEFLSLLGPSGCGKSTTLAMIAGFLEPGSGDILVDGVSVNGIPPQKRRIGMVFQDYAVFSKMTVAANLKFGLDAQSVPADDRAERIGRIVDKLNLGALLSKRGDSLNMSEMQRVALARVLVTEPSLLLLDEPMSNLDASVRESLRRELKVIQRELDQAVLYVTHDQLEAMSMSDRIAIMNDGDIVQIGTPLEIYNRPTHRFVAEFIGDPPINLVDCTVRDGQGRTIVQTAHQTLAFPSPLSGTAGRHLLAVRPHGVIIRSDASADSMTATVNLVENLGVEHVVHFNYGDDRLRATVKPGQAKEGDIVHVSLDVRHSHLIDAATGMVLR